MSDRIIKIHALYGLVQFEPYVLLGCLMVIAWIFYKFFLKEVSEERHRSIQNHFSTLIRHFGILSFLFALFVLLQTSEPQIGRFTNIAPYIGVFAYLWGNIVFVKTSRLLVLQYLFLGSMKHGVPLLIVNIFSLLLSIVLGFWGVSHIFGLDLGPLLATSAAASVILGFALQDTLGNLFAGISLQVDRNFEIGDWLEITSGIQKATGQVREITWRSVTMVGLFDEVITFPNRFIANAQISNFSPPDHPVIRRQIFRLAYGENHALAKQLLEQAVAGISEIRSLPTPFAYISDITDSWVELKIIYFIDHFGSQFSIGDKVYSRGLEALHAAGIKLARQIIEVSAKTGSHDDNLSKLL